MEKYERRSNGMQGYPRYVLQVELQEKKKEGGIEGRKNLFRYTTLYNENMETANGEMACQARGGMIDFAKETAEERVERGEGEQPFNLVCSSTAQKQGVRGKKTARNQEEHGA